MKRWPAVVGGLVLVAAAYFAVAGRGEGAAEIEYRYAPVERGDLLLSSSAVGQLVPLTRVDVKSKAGGKVVRLLVEEGSVVRQGDVIARIDPRDTQTTYDQAQADLQSAQARTEQARLSAALEARAAENRVRDAEIALATARLRLESGEDTASSQPAISQAELRSAEAGLRNANEALRMYAEVTAPQARRDAAAQLSRAAADRASAQSELDRQMRLLEKGYVSLASVERQRSALAAAEAAHATAEQRSATVDVEVGSQTRALEARVRQAEEALRQAKASQNRVPIAQRDYEQAKQAVRAAEVALQRAKDERTNVAIRRSEIETAAASAVRSRVAVRNALTQLNETTVIAPRDGVVTVKYIEEGTIIPPGTSTFAQGTSLVQIADVSRMFIECSVDETDIATVRPGQPVKIVVEAYPGQEFRGVVRKSFPAAETTQSLTTVKVRVEVTKRPEGKGGQSPLLRPGMNATCEFVLLEKADVLAVPQQAVRRDGATTYVLLKTANPKKPQRREVKLGASGNETIEVLSGLNEGDEVVVAEIDIKAMRDRQARMEQAQQGGGFGSLNRGGPSRSLASGGGTGGGGGQRR